jgi:signal transduction histidine kinase
MPGALPFSIACVFGLLWSIGSIFEFAALDIDLKIFWRKFQVVFQLPSATAITCFLLEYAWPKRWLTRRNLLLLSIIPVMAILLIITNDLHHLFWEGFIYNGGLVANPGFMMKYFIAYIFLNFVMNMVVFIWLFIHSPQNRWPVAIMVIGQIMMRLFYWIDLARRSEINIKYAPIGIAFTSLMYAIIFFRFRILGPIPLACQAVINQIPMGMLVLDHQLKITSLNSMAERILQVSNQRLKNRHIRDVLDAYPQDLPNENDVNHLEFNLHSGDKVRNYLLDILWLKDWRGDPVGQLLLMTDVTEQREAQAKLLEQGRVLATLQEREMISRELHDDLAQVFAFIDTQGQTIQRLLKRGDFETADKYLARLIDAARGGDVDIRESIRGMRLSLSKHGLVATLENYLAQFEDSTSIHTELIKSDDFDIDLVNPMVEVQLLRILQESLTNIRKHANASQVRINFAVIDSSICVAVQDNGRGIDLEQVDVTAANRYGLKMMCERVESVGGKIQIHSQPDQGTEISVCVPIHKKSVEA